MKSFSHIEIALMQSVSSSLDDANIVVCFNVVEIILSYKIFNNLVYLSPEAKL